MEDASRRRAAFVQYAMEFVMGPFAGVAHKGDDDWVWDACLLDKATAEELQAPAQSFADIFALSHGYVYPCVFMQTAPAPASLAKILFFLIILAPLCIFFLVAALVP
jgi:hypothetical protein